MQIDPKEFSLKTIAKMIKRVGFNRKRVRKVTLTRNFVNRKNERYQKSKEILTALYLGKELVYIDESSVNQSLVPVYGYSLIGKRCCLHTLPKSTNISILAAIKKDELLAFQLVKGSVTNQEYGGFLVNLISKVPGMEENLKNLVFISDNVRFHKAKAVMPIYQHINNLFIAPYSPFMNAIEEFFGNLKYHFRKENLIKHHDVITQIRLSAIYIKKRCYLGFYKRALSHYALCLRKKDIVRE